MLDATAQDSDPLVQTQIYSDRYCCFFPNKPSLGVATLIPLAGCIATAVLASKTTDAQLLMRVCLSIGSLAFGAVTLVGGYVLGCT